MAFAPHPWLNDRWPLWAAKVLRFLSKLIRTKTFGLEQFENTPNFAAAHWHGDELALTPRFGHLALTILVSHSKDGESMTRAAQYLGYQVKRGSSSRGGAAGLIALIKAVRDGRSVVLAVDGPRGPRGVCKPGIVRLAQKTGVPLFPVGVASSKKWTFEKAWNKAFIPLPFSRLVVLVGKPLTIPASSSEKELEQNCRAVEEALRQAHDEAQQKLEAWA
ncbi:MAG: lysophospholipid acyltransferase family protein [Deltaproteobacteria bacterium]|nr:lysophospholipid acyltransferase family protein [Deltaproteobacteria bacterium]